MRDIILIGMPGCGKSTLGRGIAKKLGREFVDTDIEIERSERRCIPEIFKNRGEKYFRECETQILKKLLGNNYVIATGGGIILKDENVKLMRESGAYILFIDRPPENIVGDVRTSNRPLLASGAERIFGLYKERYEKYVAACDERVLNDKDANTAIKKIEKLLEKI